MVPWSRILPFFFGRYCLWLLLLALCLHFYVKKYDIQGVRVESSYRYVTTQDLQTLIEPAIQGGHFLTLSLPALHKTILSHPWIKSVAIYRVWPAALTVRIEEQEPLAFWNKNEILTTMGTVAPRPALLSADQTWPELSGPAGLGMSVWSYYTRLDQLWKKQGHGDVAIHALHLSDQGSWTVVFDNGLKLLLGKTEILQRFGRFLKHIHHYGWPKGSKTSIDLRYASGLAVAEQQH